MFELLTLEKSNASDSKCLINFEKTSHLMISIVVLWFEIVQSLLYDDNAEDFEDLEISEHRIWFVSNVENCRWRWQSLQWKCNPHLDKSFIEIQSKLKWEDLFENLCCYCRWDYRRVFYQQLLTKSYSRNANELYFCWTERIEMPICIQWLFLFEI